QDKWRSSFIDLHQPSGPPDSLSVRGLMKDRQDALWIATGTGIYHRRPNGDIERIAEREGLVLSLRGPMLEDRDGGIWVCSWNGLYQLVSDPQPGRTVTARVWTTKDGLASNAIISLFQASDGRLW